MVAVRRGSISSGARRGRRQRTRVRNHSPLVAGRAPGSQCQQSCVALITVDCPLPRRGKGETDHEGTNSSTTVTTVFDTGHRHRRPVEHLRAPRIPSGPTCTAPAPGRRRTPTQANTRVGARGEFSPTRPTLNPRVLVCTSNEGSAGGVYMATVPSQADSQTLYWYWCEFRGANPEPNTLLLLAIDAKTGISREEVFEIVRHTRES